MKSRKVGGFFAHNRNSISTLLVTSLAVVILITFLAPLGYIMTTAIKSPTQMADPKAPYFWPFSRKTVEYQGKALELFNVPIDGNTRQLAMLEKTNLRSIFIDPSDPKSAPIVWEGNWRKLEPVFFSDPQWNNFKDAWKQLNFLLLLRNSLIIAIVGTIGAVFSSTIVAYGFARFKFRHRKLLFIILISTIILPVQATLIPTYLVYSKIGWTNTFLPLLIPHFFANAYNVFLMHQFFLQIPRELDEAATIDGANPIQIFTKVVLPNAIPAVTAVCLFHFFFAWNDFFSPLIYLASSPDLWPLSVGLQKFNALHGRQPNLIQTSALITMILPVTVFFLTQKIFMQGVVFSGVEK